MIKIKTKDYCIKRDKGGNNESKNHCKHYLSLHLGTLTVRRSFPQIFADLNAYELPNRNDI